MHHQHHQHHDAAAGTPQSFTIADGREDPPRSRDNYAHIPGWGSDLDRANRPGYPMERKPPRLHGVHWQQPEQQPQKVEVLHSIERPAITPVFGSTVPPSGASGGLRRMAFKWSENDLRHWLLLLLADRVNMVEGLADDISHGHVPNVLREMGVKAELKHNPAGAARKAALLGAVAGASYLLWQRQRRRRWLTEF